MRKCATLLFLVFLIAGCSSEPGVKYTVKVTAIQTMKNSPYCVFAVEPTNAAQKLPRDFFVDTCNKYKVDDVISIEMNGLGWYPAPD